MSKQHHVTAWNSFLNATKTVILSYDAFKCLFVNCVFIPHYHYPNLQHTWDWKC